MVAQATVIIAIGLMSVGMASAPKGEQPTSCALYALSRGGSEGVPQDTRNALQKVRETLEEAKQRGDVVNIIQTRIGLEGEVRLCAEFRDAETGEQMLAQIRPMIEDVQLLNLKIEPCRKDGPSP